MTKVSIVTIFILALFLLPGVIHAQSINPLSKDFQIVEPCNEILGVDGNFSKEEECNFNHLVQTTQNLINFIIAIAVFLAAIAFIWAGVLYMTSAGDEGKVKQAHTIFKNAAIGFIIALAAWLIVFTITNAFLQSGFTLLGSPNN